MPELLHRQTLFFLFAGIKAYYHHSLHTGGMEAVLRLIGYYYFAPTLAGLVPPFRMMFTCVELSANIQQYFGILKKSQLFSNHLLKTAAFFFCIHP